MADDRQTGFATGVMGLLAVVGVIVVGLAFWSYRDTDPVHDVYDQCLEAAPDFTRADHNLARAVERDCHAKQQAAYMRRDAEGTE